MDILRRHITKIAREVNKFTVRMLKEDGIGAAEFDFIHVVRKNPGITQAGVREILSLDKGAAARRTARLEAKGYLIRRKNPADSRSQLLVATEKAEKLKNSKAFIESLYYEWLMQALSEPDKEELARLMDVIYQRSKSESKAGFPHVTQLFEERKGLNDAEE